MSDTTSFCREWHRGAAQLFLAAVLLLAGRVLAVAQDLDPILVGKALTIPDAMQVVVRNNMAYVANVENGLRIYSITNPANPVLLGSYVTAEFAVGVALGNFASTNYAYVATGVGGVDIVDISNPSNPRFAGNINDGVIDLQANGVLINPNGNYLFIADDGLGMKIFNIANPTNQDSTFLLGQTMTADTAYGLAFNPNVTIGAGVYVADGASGVTKVDTSDKTNPFVPNNGTYTPDAGGTCYGVAADANNVYMACAEAGVQVANDAFTIFGRQYPTGADARGVFLRNSTLYVADSDGGVVILDVTTPSAIKRIGGFYTGFGNTAYGLTVSGSNIVVAAGGLQIIGTNLLANPQKIARYYVAPNLNLLTDGSDIQAVAVSGNYAFVSDAANGLQVLNISNLTSLKLMTNASAFVPNGLPTSMGFVNFPNGLQTSGSIVTNVAYMTEGNAGLEVVDISSVTNLNTLNEVALPGFSGDLAISSNFAYVVCGNSGLAVVDISDTEFPAMVTNYVTGGFSGGIVISNGFAYVADGNKGLTVYQLNDPAHPTLLGSVASGGSANDIALSGHYAFIADGGTGLSVMDIADPFHPVRVAGLSVGDSASGIRIQGNFAYVAAGLASLMVVDISAPLVPRRIGGNTSFDAIWGVNIFSNNVYVAAGKEGLSILGFYRPFQFSNVVSIITNTAQFFVSGPTNQPFRIQRSSNVANSNGWVDWQSVTFNNNNPIRLVDTSYPTNSQRFYRAIAP